MPGTQLNSEVEINAPASHVYGVLTDFASYHEWNPFITSIAGRLAVGEQLALELSLPEGKTHAPKPHVTCLTENAELRWRGHFLLPALLDVEHFFQLSARDELVTRFVQGANWSGFLLRFNAQTLTLTMRGFVYMNQALKKRAESTFR